ncbi:HD domain-containing protein [Rhizobium sp. Rhizsp82]|uniref:phosphoribosyltransferase-like protein n=1 Tax=Rhizobium sp. Rhizsp82 TaxID=3243057 RepID=UPI0039B575C7
MSALEEVARAVAAKYLGPYISRVAESAKHNISPKQIHDRVWGTIVLTPLEISLVDSPLIQRLRYLRQLGVAQWVYPSAGHTRFEHSLGVLHQTHQLITAINQASVTKHNRAIISNELTVVLRTAALMHDVGHPVLSHVSEYALEVNPQAYLELTRQRKTFGAGAKLSEIVAALVVRSPEFTEVLTRIFDAHSAASLPTHPWRGKVDEFVDKVAKCILGQSISNEIPLLHELISGPFDADKLDYMVRDASMAGIPGIIDISRLVQKVTVRRVQPVELPNRLAKTIAAGVHEVFLIGFPWSGLSVVDELLLTKMILFSKLYQHPKVVAIEAMIWAIVNSLSKVIGHEKLISFVYDILDDELVLSNDDALRQRLSLPARGENHAADVAVSQSIDILSRLRERNLFVRSFAFSPHNPSGIADVNSPAMDAMVDLVKRLNDRDASAHMHGRVVEETIAVCRYLGVNVSDDYVRSMIVIRKKMVPSQEELRRAYIFPSQGAPKTFGETGIHKDAWSSSFESAAPKGYIFSPREISPYVFVATEAVIAEEFGIAVPEWLMEEAKQSIGGIREVKLKLRELGYYKGRPSAIRPVQERVRRADVEKVVGEFADRFSSIQAKMEKLTGEIESHGGSAVMRRRAQAWLDQFAPEYIEPALDLLSRARLLGRDDVAAALRDFLDNYPAFKSASVVGLSQGNESSQIVQYYAADVSTDLQFFPSLQDAARANRDQPILFLDDFCASGGQISNLLGAWFDNAKLKKSSIKEQRRLALEPERDYLRKHEVGFCFVAAWRDGLESVQFALKEIGLQGIVYSHLHDEDIPVAFDDRYIEPEVLGPFREYCQKVGLQLLKNEPDWDDKKRKDRACGYGNRGLLLFFPYNSPAQSLTCIWSSGEVEGETWQALIPRRKKVTS